MAITDVIQLDRPAKSRGDTPAPIAPQTDGNSGSQTSFAQSVSSKKGAATSTNGSQAQTNGATGPGETVKVDAQQQNQQQHNQNEEVTGPSQVPPPIVPVKRLVPVEVTTGPNSAAPILDVDVDSEDTDGDVPQPTVGETETTPVDDSTLPSSLVAPPPAHLPAPFPKEKTEPKNEAVAETSESSPPVEEQPLTPPAGLLQALQAIQDDSSSDGKPAKNSQTPATFPVPSATVTPDTKPEQIVPDFAPASPPKPIPAIPTDSGKSEKTNQSTDSPQSEQTPPAIGISNVPGGVVTPASNPLAADVVAPPPSRDSKPVESHARKEGADNPSVDGSAEPGATKVSRSESHADTKPDATALGDQMRFSQRVVNALRHAVTQDRSFRVRLNPPELGVLQIEISTENGQLTARMEVQNIAAQNALTENLSHLHSSLSRHGIVIDRIDVQVVESQPGDSAQDGTGGNPDDSAPQQYSQNSQTNQQNEQRRDGAQQFDTGDEVDSQSDPDGQNQPAAVDGVMDVQI